MMDTHDVARLMWRVDQLEQDRGRTDQKLEAIGVGIEQIKAQITAGQMGLPSQYVSYRVAEGWRKDDERVSAELARRVTSLEDNWTKGAIALIVALGSGLLSVVLAVTHLSGHV